MKSRVQISRLSNISILGLLEVCLFVYFNAPKTIELRWLGHPLTKKKKNTRSKEKREEKEPTSVETVDRPHYYEWNVNKASPTTL